MPLANEKWWKLSDIQEPVDVCPDPNGIVFLDSWSRADDFVFDLFRPEGDAAIPFTDYDAPVLKQTCVPDQRNDISWEYDRVTGYGADTPTTERVQLSGGTFHANYGNPSVVRMPNGGWLMFRTRTVTDVGGAPQKGQGLEDILMWYCSNSDFDSTTKGPYFIVSGPVDDGDLHTGDRVEYLDPDPVQLPTGEWRVYCGVKVEYSNTSLPFTCAVGEPSDACVSWEDMFPEATLSHRERLDAAMPAWVTPFPVTIRRKRQTT